jgi:hypothetical protein
MAKHVDYIEGPQARKNFEQLATTVLQAKYEKEKKQAKPASQNQQQKSDKG